ncbi:hypothetical protein DY023_11420 [Microbacterium bovistercoris]|uniref:Uncharacterized protein n=1 Tax=Microbacterium bovistercoris TaxID=2293570 RepID=A0A371NU40_9MICO|nr:hypothetical protein [Microbacterium bovistercoris]REJ05173.1 hypothetical protein DY023_11420 [Microbacterium bovistercoris]
MDIEYAAFKRNRLDHEEVRTRHYDLYLAALNDSARVHALADAVQASRKVWLVHDEYGYVADELPDGEIVHASRSSSPAESWAQVLHELKASGSLQDKSIAIDITGMMRLHIVMLPFALKTAGVSKVTVFYSDPDSYKLGERTTFTRGPVERVGLVPGMEGAHSNQPSPRDALIVGAGYDHSLVTAVLEDKPNAEHVILLGLPGLQPHMYQESMLMLANSSNSIRSYRPGSHIFAPANDPFATAHELSSKVDSLGELDHLYLSAVGAKPHVLGFAWYYWCEGIARNASFLVPFAERYDRETTKGVAAVHEYILELDFVREAVPPAPAVLGR